MREGGLPCSVITSHREPQDSSPTRTSVLQQTLCVQVFSTSDQTEQPNHLESIQTTLLRSPEKNENLEVWPNSSALENNGTNIELPEKSQMSCRVRKQKRPYSPIQSERRSLRRKMNSVKTRNSSAIEDAQSYEKPFVCGRCSSPYVVNPARSHSSAKTYAPRRVFDPVTKKTLLVCNACRLAIARSRKAKTVKKQPPPTEEMKTKFEEECANFSARLVDQMKDSDAGRLYCPVFTLHPCRCLQNYLTSPGEEEQSLRAVDLLNILKNAKQLSTLKNSYSHIQNPRPPGLLRRKSHVFEEFVQEKRVYLRTQLKLCERACQRILMYSNNFLHKQLKSAPDQSARIHQLGGSSRQPLCPISKLPNENCCQDRCVLMALTHSHLLEDWRKTARRSQRDARRVLAEMLTPSGGSKANCYKFIKMVTGCSHTTICLVNEQMWRTQGNREPPEHGLRRWWRQQTGHKTAEGPDSAAGEASTEDNDTDLEYDEEEQQDEERSQDTVPDGEETVGPSITEIHIPTARELRELTPAEAGRRLLQQRRKLASVQRQLARQQRHIEVMRQQRPPIVLGCCSGTADLQPVQQATVVQQPATIQTVTPQPQVVHILEIPATPASVIPSLPDPIQQQQPTISVLSSSGEFEPISNISVNVAPGQPLGTVFFVPEYEAVPTISADHTPAGSNMIYMATSTEGDAVQLQHNLAAQPQMATSTSSPSQPQQQAATRPQPIALPSMQFHLPLDIPVHVAVQSTTDSTMQTAEQPPTQPTLQIAAPPSVQSSACEHPPSTPTQSQSIILPAPQSISYQVTQPVAPSSSTTHHISLQNTPTAVVNVINKDNHCVQTSEPHVYYLETVNCVSSVSD